MKKLIIVKLVAMIMFICFVFTNVDGWDALCADKVSTEYITNVIKKETDYYYNNMDFLRYVLRNKSSLDGVIFTKHYPHYKDSTGGKNYKVEKTAYAAGRPEAEDYSFGSVKLSWKKVSGAYGYEVGARSLDKDKNAETSYTNWRYMHTSATSCTVNGLDLSERFKFRVRAVRRVKSGKAYLYYYGPWSDAVAVKMPKGATGVDVKVGETKSDIYTFYNTFTQETEPCTVKSGDFTFSYCSDYRKVNVEYDDLCKFHDYTTYDREGTYFVKNVKEEPDGVQIWYANNPQYSNSGQYDSGIGQHRAAYSAVFPKEEFTTKTAVWKSTLSAIYKYGNGEILNDEWRGNNGNGVGWLGCAQKTIPNMPIKTNGSKKTVTQDVTVHTYKLSVTKNNEIMEKSQGWNTLYLKCRAYYLDADGNYRYSPWTDLLTEEDKFLFYQRSESWTTTSPAY